MSKNNLRGITFGRTLFPGNMSGKFKGSTQRYKFFFNVATAIVTDLYSKNLTKTIDKF